MPQREYFGVFTATVGAHCVGMFTTTYMEEEHMIVYFLVSFLHSQALRSVLLSSSSRRGVGVSSCLLSWICCYALRCFCSGGAKWAHYWDIRSLISSSVLLRHVLSVFSAFAFCCSAHLLRQPRLISGAFNAAIVLSVATCVDGFDQAVGRKIRCAAFLVFFAASVLGVLVFSECKIQSAAFFFGGMAFLLLNSASHAPACLAFCVIPFIASKFLPSLSSSMQGLFVNYIALHSAFSVGMSNSLSSVDILAPFRLFENFDRWLAFIITFLCAYALPIAVSLRLLSCCSAARHVMNSVSNQLVFCSYSTSRIAVSACLCISIVILRQHLFVWTVLAPRLLFEIANGSAALLIGFVVICGMAHPSPSSKR
jgi:hypothetical protein